MNHSYSAGADHNSSPYMLPSSAKAPKGARTGAAPAHRPRGGPKRPPNAYMMCAPPPPPPPPRRAC